MTIVDLLNVQSLSSPQLSPDGSLVVYALAQADWKKNKRISHLWRVPVEGGPSIQLTSGPEGESAPRWSPDGTWIAFIANREKGEAAESHGGQVFLLRNQGGEAQQLSHHETGVSAIEWARDGSSIYFLADESKTKEERDRLKTKDDVISYDEDFKQTHLWQVFVDGGTEKRITGGDFSIKSYSLSRDGAWIVHHRAPSPLYDDEDEGEVWIMTADGRQPLRLTDNAVAEQGAQLSPDNMTVLFTSDANERFETYYNGNLFTVPATGGAARMLLTDLPYEINQAAWSKGGTAIFFTANTGVRSDLFTVQIEDGQVRQLTRGDHSISDYSYVPNLDSHLFRLNQADNPGEVYLLNGSPSQEPRPITRVFEGLAKRFRLPRQEAIQWRGADGTTVEGLLFYPLDYQAGRTYPLCVQTHGGPTSSDQFGFGGWSSYVQVLTARGWAVFKPNYRGSTGYGDAFLRDMVGHYYQNSHLDVMTGVDALIARGIADGSRMVKMGWSAGGHMTNKIITFTDRFKAASSGAGAVNWVSMYGQSDVRSYRTPWFGGTPWEKNAPIGAYWDSSPLKDISRVTTPTIILVGEKDVRVPASQSIELFRALRSNGIPTHLYVAPREPHGWQELRHELFKVNVELEWFENYALNRQFLWESAPEEDSETQGRD